MKPLTGPAQESKTLENGDRLSQPEFHRLYEAYPDDVKIELIGGTVYVASPMRTPHADLSFELAYLMGCYKAATPGLRGSENVSAILGDKSEPQPDLSLRLLPEYGGQARLDERRYLIGAPEFVVEIAHSTRSIDLNQKRRAYLAGGVQEYLVVCVEEEELHWFHFLSKRKLKADEEGVWKSRVFPGLWVNAAALFAFDSVRQSATIQQGIASPEHAAFVRALEALRK